MHRPLTYALFAKISAARSAKRRALGALSASTEEATMYIGVGAVVLILLIILLLILL
jgi:hypothetical protein